MRAFISGFLLFGFCASNCWAVVDVSKRHEGSSVDYAERPYIPSPSPPIVDLSGLGEHLQNNQDFCRGVATMAGEDPSRAALNCALKARINERSARSYYRSDPLDDYQEIIAMQEAQDREKKIKEMEQQIFNLKQCQRTGDFCF